MERQDELIEAYLRASRVLVMVAVRSIDAADPPVTAAQHRLLVLLAARGPQHVGDLAVELNVNRSNATRHCDRLERKGLVERRRSTRDARVVEVWLTAAGRALLETVTTVRRAEIGAVVDRMPRERVADALAALEAFGDAAGEVADGDWLVGTQELVSS